MSVFWVGACVDYELQNMANVLDARQRSVRESGGRNHLKLNSGRDTSGAARVALLSSFSRRVKLPWVEHDHPVKMVFCRGYPEATTGTTVRKRSHTWGKLSSCQVSGTSTANWLYILWLGHGPHWRCIFEIIGVADFKASFSWFNCMFQRQILTKIALSQSGRDCLVCLELCGRPVPFFQNSKRAKCRQLSARISQPWEPGRHIPPERPGAKWTITKVDIRETILH